MASGSSDHVGNLIDKGVVDHFVRLLSSPHIEVVEQVIWGLGNIAGDGTNGRSSVINAGAVTAISDILDHAQPGTSFMRNVSWALTNLCRGKP